MQIFFHKTVGNIALSDGVNTELFYQNMKKKLLDFIKNKCNKIKFNTKLIWVYIYFMKTSFRNIKRKTYKSFFRFIGCSLIIIFFATNLSSCYKVKPAPVPTFRSDNLLAITWGLKSINSINSVSFGLPHTYHGNPSDSLIFLWRLNPNVDLYGINSFIGQTNTMYTINKFAKCTSVPPSDTGNIVYDTLILNTRWKTNYSDTLFITKISDNLFIFQVRYFEGNTSGVEIDSFYNLRYH